MEHIRIWEAFSGYGSQSMALKRLQEEGLITYEVVGISEIDPNAIKLYNAVHGYKDEEGRVWYPNDFKLETWLKMEKEGKLTPCVKNYGDITKIDWNEVPDFDMLTWSSPCQDISNAGLQRGLEAGSGTRSSLIWFVIDAVRIKKPKYILMENVKALVSKKFLPTFTSLLDVLKELGYSTPFTVMNAKDYGVPQNRERVFCLSFREDVAPENFKFPKGFPLEKVLKDVLEENVSEEFYLSEKSVEGFMLHNENHKKKQTGFI